MFSVCFPFGKYFRTPKYCVDVSCESAPTCNFTWVRWNLIFVLPFSGHMSGLGSGCRRRAGVRCYMTTKGPPPGRPGPLLLHYKRGAGCSRLIQTLWTAPQRGPFLTADSLSTTLMGHFCIHTAASYYTGILPSQPRAPSAVIIRPDRGPDLNPDYFRGVVRN